MAESIRKTQERMFEILTLERELIELQKEYKAKKQLFIDLKKQDLLAREGKI